VWPELQKWVPESLLPCLEVAAELRAGGAPLEQLFSALQACALQLGDVAVDGLWGGQQRDVLALAAQLREVGPAPPRCRVAALPRCAGAPPGASGAALTPHP
jgi:hypothetical protein